MSLYTVIGHSSGEWIGGEMSIPLPKFDPQAYGSALTYARRYALGSFVGVVTDDDDGNAASQPSENAVANDKPTKRENWGGRFPNKTSLHQALGTVDHNLRGCGDIDELEAYLATDEYKDFVKIAGEKAPHYLHGGDPAPEEFVGIFDLEKTTRDELSQKEAA